MRKLIIGLLAASAMNIFSTGSNASSLSISPVTLEVAAPGAATSVSLENSGEELMSAQVRVFKWVQNNGKDELVPTRDVVASPPAIKIEPGKKTMVRVVRITKAPVATEENYRLIVSEVPRPDKAAASINVAIQYSVPVFFASRGGQQQLTWNARINKGKLIVEAANAGTRRARLTNMKVNVEGGKTILSAEGLAGYVLADSSRFWVANPRTLKPGTKLIITAQTDQGPVNATASVAVQ